MRRLFCIFAVYVVFFVCGLFGFIGCYMIQIPESLRCFNNEFPKPQISGINLFKNSKVLPVGKNFFSFANNEQFTALLFNLIPVKNIDVHNLGKRVFVSPCGTPFGLKILTDGVLVLDLQKIKTLDGEKFPACKANLKKGDFLVSVNGRKIYGNSQLRSLVQKSEGKPLKLMVKRGSKLLETEICPVLSDRKKWAAGILVRDSYAGLGTLTYSTKSGYFGGLGHAVYDIDTGNSLPIGCGEIVEAEICDVVQGSCSKPGELCGDLKIDKSVGKIEINAECGLYGVLNEPVAPHEFIPLGLSHEAEMGKAYIYSTIDGVESKEYEVEIESINYRHDVKNFVLKVVDRELLKKTGGIVQGMSGSPIVQNGKLIGAVTHVFCNDPTRGYGVFAETMFAFSQELAKNKNI